MFTDEQIAQEECINNLWEYHLTIAEYDYHFLQENPEYRDLIESCKPDIRTKK